MANIKSSKKRARQDVERKQRNAGRKTALKTAVKKVLAALEQGEVTQAQVLLKNAEAQLARAGNKGVLHKRTASRRIGRLAHKVSTAVVVATK